MAQRFLFTKENARFFAARGAATRKRRQAEREELARNPPPLPPLLTIQPPEDAYPRVRLGRVRAQLDRLDEAIQAEVDRRSPDGQRLNWLAQAQERLAEQERLLAGRPLPGSRKPPVERGTPTRDRPQVLFTVPEVQEGGQPKGIYLPAPTVPTPPPAPPQQSAAPAQNETPPCKPGEQPYEGEGEASVKPGDSAGLLPP